MTPYSTWRKDPVSDAAARAAASGGVTLMADWSEADWKRSTLCGAGSCLEVAVAESHVAMRDSKVQKGPILQFDQESWEEFLAGVRGGEFDLVPEVIPENG